MEPNTLSTSTPDGSIKLSSPKFSEPEITLMHRALTLAKRGLYTTHPNPSVGCVIAHGMEIVGEGWHHRTGEPHAEIHALDAAGKRALGATAYVSLEPCSYHGRTPPCTDALIQAGIKEVIVATEDPNPRVSGTGVSSLRSAGLTVHTGLCREAAERLNRGFIKRMRSGRCWVRIKLAMSLDGRTALANGESRWITGAPARRDVQHWRARASAICTGIGTVLADNPRLTVRTKEWDLPKDYLAPERTPLRVIADTHLRTPINSCLLSLSGPVVIATACEDALAYTPYQAKGITILPIPNHGQHLDLQVLIEELGKLEVNELHVEAGPTLAGAFLETDSVDELITYVAPIVLGNNARALFHLPPLAPMAERRAFQWVDVRPIGADIRLLLRPT